MASRVGVSVQASTRRLNRFSPLWLPGLALWLRGDGGVVLSGGNVSRWDDRSGNGNHAQQPTGANQPGYVAGGGAGGNSYLNFVAANSNRLFVPNASSIQLATNVAIMLVVSNIVSVDSTWVVKGRSAVSFNYGISQLGTNVMRLKSNSGDFSFQDLDTTGDIGINNGTMVLAHWDNNDQVCRVDADVQVGANAMTFGASTVDLDIGAISASPGPTYSGHMTVRLYEIAIWNRRLTSGEEAQLKSYTANRYGAA